MEELSVAGGWQGVLAMLFRREDLSFGLAKSVLGSILDGEAQPSQIGAFLAALRTKGETSDEVAGLAEAMRERCERVTLSFDAIDTCGTGGDRAHTINVSTTAAFVAAAAGVPVCKHGGGAVSSSSGSADVLRALGAAVELGPDAVQRCVEEVGIGFCFAPRFHPAMRHVGPIRRELGVATVFNFLGPLTNPAGVHRQVVGVGDMAMAELVLTALENQGATHAMVVYGHDGLDELSVCAQSTILETVVRGDGSRERTVRTLEPESLGIERAKLEDLRGGDAEHNAERVRRVLGGEGGPQRDFVLLNAAAALVVSGIVGGLAEGLETAARVIDGGDALGRLDAFVATTQHLEAESTG